MSSRSTTRWLAPLALAGAAAALFATVTGGGEAEVVARRKSVVTATTTPAKPTTYTVRSGDLLSTIAESTGVSLARIEHLNPDVDAKTLHAGQRIKLAP